MFKFDYSLSENDYLEYNYFHALYTKLGKKNYLIYRLVLPFFAVFALIIMAATHIEPKLFRAEAVVLAILSVCWFFFSKKLYLRTVRKNVKKAKKNNSKLFSTSGTISFDEEGLTEASNESESKMKYSAIENIGVSSAGIYVFITPVQAFIVPSRIFSSLEEKEEFLGFLSEKTKISPIFPQNP